MTDRHTFVDALRGFALLGIIVVNIEFIVQPSEIGFGEYTGGIDRLARWFIVAFGQTKVYPIFALLFGYGLAVQTASARTRGHDLAPRYRRRMIGLVLLGVLHGVFFFPGDILVIYAAIGALAFRFRHQETARLLRIAVRTYVIAAAIWVAVGIIDMASFGGPAVADPAVVETLTTGSFLDVAATQVWYWLVTLAILCAVQGPAVFASFLVGIALGRTRILAEPDQHRDLGRRVLRWAPLGLLGAAIGATLTVYGGRWATLGFAIGFAAAPLVAAGYIAALGMTIGRGNGWLSQALQASGRMSLTVYLLESVVVAALSYGYGFGLFGTVTPLTSIGIAVDVWTGLSIFAILWMRFFRFGPLEWGLRSFTYGKRQSLR